MVLDDFIFRHRMQDGTTIIDSFLRQSRHLTREERATLLAWRDPVEGLFEVQRQYEDSVLLLNLVDDLEYRVYSNMGPGVFRPVKRGAFVQGRIVPVRDVWVVSGMLAGLDKSRAAEVAGVAMELAVQIPRWAFRNEELLERNWAMMAEKRAEFIATFGSDEVLLAPGEVEKRMANLGYGGSAGPKLPEEAYRCETVAFVFDEDDGLAVFLDYGKLHDLFADPSLAKDRERADLLLGYLRSDSVNPCAVRRLAETYPEHADAVFQTVLKQRHFSWAAHGEALLRKHKPWYYEQDQLPAMLVFGKRLTQLLGTSARAVEALCGRCGHRRYDGCFLGCGRAGADRVGGATVCVHKKDDDGERRVRRRVGWFRPLGQDRDRALGRPAWRRP